MPRRARIDATGALHHIVIRWIERKMIFKGGTDREDFIMRLSSLLQEMDADESAGIDLSAVIAAAFRYLGIEEKKLSRRFNVDRSAVSRAGQRVSRNPELPAAIKTIQRELESNQH